MSSYASVETRTAGAAVLGRLVGIAAAVLAIAGVVTFPVGRLILGLLLLAYAILLLWQPRLWLVVIPALIPTFDLAPWTGRIFFNALDFALLVTIATLYLREPRRALPRPWHPGQRVISLFAASVLLSTLIGLFPLAPVDANSFANYLSPYNALRIAKGFFLAWLLLPYLGWLLEKNRSEGLAGLSWGILLGIIGFGVTILWERGVLLAFSHWQNIYAVLGSILNETTAYRATGLLAGMHTGGAEIDSYISTTMAFVMLPFLFRASWRLRVAAILALILGMYGALSTFSRGTYIAVAASALTATVVLIASRGKQQWAGREAVTWGAIAIVAVSDIAWLVFGYGGSVALLACGVTQGMAVATGFMMRSSNRLANVLISLIPAVFGALLLLRAITTSKWTHTDHGMAVFVSAVAAIVISVLGMEFGRRVRSKAGFLGSLATVGIVTVLWFVVIPAFSGYRMNYRFETTSEDAKGRMDHWLDALSFIRTDAFNLAFGMGLGSFPRLYFTNHVGDLTLASYRFVKTPHESYLSLGQGEFGLTQRIPVVPDNVYRLTIRFRGNAREPSVAVGLCPRNILHTEYVGGCVSARARIKTDNQWKTWTGTLNSGKLGSHGWLYWPTVVDVRNGSAGHGTVDIDYISLKAPDGREIIANGDFSQGADRWYLVSDTEHLEWHPKNIFVATMVEQGACGAVLLIVLALAGVLRQWKAARAGDPLACVLLASLAGAFTVGMIGTIVDVPRVAMLFYFVLFLSVTVPTAEIVGKASGGRADHRSVHRRHRHADRAFASQHKHNLPP